jgi:class 3 adenylate cyclase
MAGVIRKNFDQPDSRDEIPLGLVELIQVGSVQVGRETLQPGWRWSTHIKPIVGTDLCEFHHVGIELSGEWICEARDGTQTLIRPGDVYDIAPGHDSWVVGDEPAVNVDFQGVAGWALPPAAGQRTLLTVLFTDIVESTAAAERMGDRRWGMLLGQHREDVQRLVGDHRGHVVKSTGDGYLATFERPAAAVACAAAIRESAHRLGLQVRAGVHTGEVELTDDDVRGVAVHLAARIVDVAAAEEIVVSATTRDLVTGTDLVFEDKGTFDLKGISGERTLYALGAP